MRINAKVTAVEQISRRVAERLLVISLSGYAEAQGEYNGSDELSCKLQVPSNSTSQKAYHVGREVVITVEPQP